MAIDAVQIMFQRLEQNPDLLEQVKRLAAKVRTKSNDRMEPRSSVNLHAFVYRASQWDSPHKDEALKWITKAGPEAAFEILHSMRRWYSGQTMAGKLIGHREHTKDVMKLDPEHVEGVYRGFKVDKDSDLAGLKPGDRVDLPVTRNKGITSWSTDMQATNRFSGASKGKVGLIVKLVDTDGVTPILAPPSHSEPWFNEFYSHMIGKSWRPTEGEYLIVAPKVTVEVVKVKK